MTSTHAPGKAVATRQRSSIAPAQATDRRRAAGWLVRAVASVIALAGLAFGLVACAYEPLVTGPIGITLGSAGKHAGSRMGRVSVAVAMVGTILGPVFGSTVYAVLTST